VNSDPRRRLGSPIPATASSCKGHKAKFQLPTPVYNIDAHTGKTTIIAKRPMLRRKGWGLWQLAQGHT
jgi:hypothetical protein